MGWRMSSELERDVAVVLMLVEESGREETHSPFVSLLPQPLLQSIPSSGNPGISVITSDGSGLGVSVTSLSAYWTMAIPGPGRR